MKKIKKDFLENKDAELKTHLSDSVINEVEEIVTSESVVDDFRKFEESKTSLSPEIELDNSSIKSTEKKQVSADLANIIKTKLVLTFACIVLEGFHSFIYGLISKHEIKSEDMKLTEIERDSLLPYFDSPSVLNFISKIPSEIIAIIHLEYIFFIKFRSVVDKKNSESKNKI